MHAYLLSMSSPPNSDAILRQKLWLPRQFAAQVISAALEFQQLLDIQAPGKLRDPDGSIDARQGARYKNGMVMLLAAVKGSLTPPSTLPDHGWRDIVGIFALLAAEEFKYLLDVQAPGALFFPAGWRKSRSDARETATYERAANLLRDARFQVLQSTERPNEASADPISVRCVVSDHSADAAPDVVNFHLDIDAALLGLGFHLVGKGNGSSENCRLFEIRLGGAGQVDEMRKPVNCESEVVHSAPLDRIDGLALCHGSDATKDWAGRAMLDQSINKAKAAISIAKYDLAIAEKRLLDATIVRCDLDKRPENSPEKGAY